MNVNWKLTLRPHRTFSRFMITQVEFYLCCKTLTISHTLADESAIRSVDFHDRVLLIYKVLIGSPHNDAAQALSENSRKKSDKKARYAFLSIYFCDAMGNSLIMLVCVLIVELKESACSNEVQRMCDCTRNNVRHHGRNRRDYSDHPKSICFRCITVHIVLVYFEQLSSKEAVDGIETSWKWHVSYHADLQSSEETTETLDALYLFTSVHYAIIFVKSDDFQPRLYHDDWVR